MAPATLTTPALPEHVVDTIGSTDSAKILGLSRHGSPRSVYERIIGESTYDPMSLPAWLGLRLEDAVSELYTGRTGHRLHRAKQKYYHPELPFVHTHLDYRRLGEGGHRHLVECKTRAFMRDWGADGSDAVPVDVWTQVQHEMWVMDARSCEVAVLFGHHTFRVYQIEPDPEFIVSLRHELTEYWDAYVVPQVPPPPLAHDLPSIRRRYPESDGTYRSATPDQLPLVQRLLGAREAVAEAERHRDDLAAKVIELIGTADGLDGPFGRITWKATRGRTTWEKVAAAFRAELAPGYEADAVIARYTGAPGRTLGYRLKEEDE